MSALSNQIEAGRAYIAIRLDKAQLINGLADVGKRMRAFGASVQSFGSDMFRLSLIGAAPVAAAVNSFIKFDDQMRITGAIAGATKSQLQKLTDQARRLGSTTAFTAQQIASGMTAAARLGNDYAKIRKAIESYMYTTRATGNETWRLGEIAEITGNVMNQYGIQIDEVARVSDILTFASNRSAQTVQDVGQAMRSVGGIAKQLGDSIEDTVVSMNLLANRGIKGELLGTAMRKAYDGILSNEKELNKLGVATRDASNELRKPFLIIADIFETLKTKTNAEQVKIAKDIFGLRGMLAGMTLGNSVNEVKQLRTQINQIHGLAKNTAEEMESGIGGAFRKLVSMAQEVGLVIGEVLQTPMTSLMRTATGLLGTIAKFIKDNQSLVQSFVTLSAVGATAGASIMALGLALKVIAVPFSALSGILAMFKVTALTAFNALLMPLNLLGKSVSKLTLLFTALEKSATFTKYIVKGIAASVTVANAAMKSTVGILSILKGGVTGLVAFLKGTNALRHAISTGISAFGIFTQMLKMLPTVLSMTGTEIAVTGRAVARFTSMCASGFVIVVNSAKDMAKAFTWANQAFQFVVRSAIGLRTFTNGVVDAAKGVMAFVRNINIGRLVVLAYQKVLLGLRAIKTALVASFLAAKTAVIGFVQSVNIAKTVSAAYHGTINLLTSAKKALVGAIAAVKAAYIGLNKAQMMSMAVAAKPFLIALGAAAAFGAVVYGVAKAYPAVRDAAKDSLGKVKGWWDDNKAAIIDYGKTMYSAIQAGDIEGAFKVGLAGALKVFYDFASKVISLFADIRFNVLDIWDSIMDKLERSFGKMGYAIKELWYTHVRGIFDSAEENAKTINRIGDERAMFNSMMDRQRQSQRDKRELQRQQTQEFASGLVASGNAGYRQAMAFAKVFPEMQKASENLRNLMQNAAQDYRDNAFLGMYAGFKGSRDDAYTTIGTGNLNAKDSSMQKTRLQTRIKEYSQYADKLEESFNRQLKLAQKDRVITDAESEALRKLIDERGYALYMEEELRGKLQAIGETTGEKIQESEEAKKGTPSSAYSVRMLKLTNGFDAPEKRIAKATESLDKNVKWLRDYIAPIIGTVIV